MKRSGYLSARVIKSPTKVERSSKDDELDALFKQAERLTCEKENVDSNVDQQLTEAKSADSQEESIKGEHRRPKRAAKRGQPIPSSEDVGKTIEKKEEQTREKKKESESSEEESEAEEVDPEAEPDEDGLGGDQTKTAQDHMRCQFRKIAEKGIRNDLLKLNIAPEVIEIADSYYEEVTKGEIKRSNLRKGIMFACVFQAYKDLNKHQTPDYLQKLFKITRRTMSKGLTYFYPRSTKRSGDNGYITAEHFIPRVMETFNVKQEHIDAALKLYDQIKDKTTLFNSSNPQSVSSGLVYYYFKKINVDIPGKDFGKVVGLSDVTIVRIASRIDEILNS